MLTYFIIVVLILTEKWASLKGIWEILLFLLGYSIGYIIYIGFYNLSISITRTLLAPFKNSSYRSFIKKITKNCILVNNDQFQDLWVIINNILAKANLQNKKLKIYFERASSFLPSVFEVDNTILLLLPRNSVMWGLQKNNREKFEAMIAHEVGHIIQEDSKIFEKLIEASIFVNYGILITLINIINGFDIGIRTPISASFVTGLYLRDSILQSRKKSELLADTSSLLYSDGLGLVKVLNEYVTFQDSVNGIHPHPVERIKNIISIIERFSSMHNAL